MVVKSIALTFVEHTRSCITAQTTMPQLNSTLRRRSLTALYQNLHTKNCTNPCLSHKSAALLLEHPHLAALGDVPGLECTCCTCNLSIRHEAAHPAFLCWSEQSGQMVLLHRLHLVLSQHSSSHSLHICSILRCCSQYLSLLQQVELQKWKPLNGSTAFLLRSQGRQYNAVQSGALQKAAGRPQSQVVESCCC